MRKKRLFFIAMMMFVAASPVFAAHDHGSHNSMDHGTSESPKDEQSAKEGEMLINSCAQQVAGLQRRITNLQAEMAGRRVGSSVHDELRKLEQKLKEANEIVRPLQIF